MLMLRVVWSETLNHQSMRKKNEGQKECTISFLYKCKLQYELRRRGERNCWGSRKMADEHAELKCFTCLWAEVANCIWQNFTAWSRATSSSTWDKRTSTTRALGQSNIFSQTHGCIPQCQIFSHISFYPMKRPDATLEQWVYYCKSIMHFRGDPSRVHTALITHYVSTLMPTQH